jgi:L-seryl-tRNA(Ser) seleniumtransferase
MAGESAIGGGSLPGETLPTALLALQMARPVRWLAKLRRPPASGRVPVIARVEADCVLFDPRTVLPEQETDLLASIRSALEES